MATNEPNPVNGAASVSQCEHCEEPREQWQTNRYASHLARCSGISEAGQTTLDDIGESRRGP